MADNVSKIPLKTDEKSAPAPQRSLSPFESLRSEIDRLFDDFTPAFWHRPFGRLSFEKAFPAISTPAVDLVEKEKGYEITAELPGIEPKDLEVKVADGTLTIKGEKQETKEEKDKEYHLSERRYGSFQRAFQLPQSVDVSKIEASFTNGLLTVTLPKTAEAQQNERKIAINAG
jgi:HSP20 family protein